MVQQNDNDNDDGDSRNASSDSVSEIKDALRLIDGGPESGAWRKYSGVRRPITWPPAPIVQALPEEGISPRGVCVIVVCCVLHWVLIEQALLFHVFPFLR